MLTRHYKRITLALFILAVAVSTALAVFNFKHLIPHHDINLYLQFVAKLLDTSITKQYSRNVGGFNFMGLVIQEGELGFQRLIHVEGIKYLWALGYRLLPFPALIFLMFSTLYFAPLLGLSRFANPRSRHEAALLIAVALLLVFYPSTPLASVNSLRPRMLFNGALPLALLAIHFRPPHWQVILAFLLLFSLREEAALFAVPLMLFAWFQPGDRALHRKLVLKLAGIYSAYLLILLLYYLPPGFGYDPEFSSFASLLEHRRAGPALLVVGGAFAVWALRLLFLLDQGEGHLPDWVKNLAARLGQGPGNLLHATGRVAALTLLFIPLIGQAYILISTKFYQLAIVETGARIQETLYRLIFTQQLAIFGPMAAVALLIAWHNMESPRLQRMITGITLFLAVGSAALSFAAVYPTLVTHTYAAGYPPVSMRQNDASMIFELRTTADRHNDTILADLTTLAAFYDFEDAIAFDFLPFRIAPQEDRLYPESAPYLRMLIIKEVDYIAIHKNSDAAMQELLVTLPVRVNLVAQNANFIVYRVVR